MAGRSLRFHLTLWYSGLLATTLIAFSIILFMSLSKHLQRHHDEGMIEVCKEALLLIRNAGGCTKLDAIDREALSRLGHLVRVRPVIGFNPVSPADPLRPAVILKTRHEGNDQIRVASTIITPVDHSSACLIEVTDSLGDFDSTMAGLRLLLLALVPLVLALATLGGMLIIRKALRPLEEMAILTRRIEATKLGLRLDLHRAPQEIANLAATFNQMIGRLESSFENMKRFTADASHELRTPLTVLTSSIEIALQRDRPAEQYQRVMQSSLAEVQRLTQIVEDLLLVAQAEAGKLGLHIEQVFLGTLLRESVVAIQSQARAAGLVVNTENMEEVIINGDSRWLRQLFDNLLDNAIKYTPRGGSITLSTRRKNHQVVVGVSDTGIGIPEPELSHIFERFHRVDPSRSRNRGGVGLGLPIALWVARAHGGHIELKSIVGHGSDFRVILPTRADIADGTLLH